IIPILTDDVALPKRLHGLVAIRLDNESGFNELRAALHFKRPRTERSVDLSLLMKEAAQQIKDYAGDVSGGKSLKVDTQIEEGVFIPGDEVQLRLAIRDVATNAVVHGDVKGLFTIALRTRWDVCPLSIENDTPHQFDFELQDVFHVGL